MTKEEQGRLEEVVHDSWSMLNLMTYAMQDALTNVSLIDGTANTPSAIYGIDDDSLSALWGTLEAMNLTREMLWTELQKI